MSMLPTDAKERKNLPIGTGVLDYFPDALAEVSKASLAGNKQHLDGLPLQWDRSKSTDESDALIRHFLERDKMDDDGVLHAGKMCWRALAYLQKLIESRRESEKNPLNGQPFRKPPCRVCGVPSDGDPSLKCGFCYPLVWDK